MKTYERSFVNPLLAMAFVDGVEFLNDENIVVSRPIRESDTVWKVTIVDKDDEEDDTVTEKPYPCGVCIGCTHHDSCIEEVNAACIAEARENAAASG